MSVLADLARGVAAGAGDANPVTAVANFAKGVLDRVIPDPAQKQQAQLAVDELAQTGELAQLASDTQLALGQIGINAADAASRSFFQAGWRPYIGWTCGGGLSYQLIARPLLGWVFENTMHWTQPPTLDMNTLGTILFGILGLGGYRSWEKIKGVAK